MDISGLSDNFNLFLEFRCHRIDRFSNGSRGKHVDWPLYIICGYDGRSSHFRCENLVMNSRRCKERRWRNRWWDNSRCFLLIKLLMRRCECTRLIEMATIGDRTRDHNLIVISILVGIFYC